MLRPATIQDLTRLREIERAAGAAFRSIGMEAVADDAPPSVEELEPYVRAGRAWVADADKVPVAYLIADIVDGNGHVEQVSVHPSHAGQGLGRALIDRAAKWAADNGFTRLTLTTFTEVPWNGPYYARLGFEPVDRRSRVPSCGRCASTRPRSGWTAGRARPCHSRSTELLG